MKAIKQHIINLGNELVCGLKKRDHIKTAFIDPDDSLLYDADCNKINHKNMDCICRNCLKMFHPTYFNDLLIERDLDAYRQSLPKSNRERNKKHSMKRKQRNESFHKNHNVIHLGLNPTIQKPITDPAFLLPEPIKESKCKVIAKPKPKKKTIAKKKTKKTKPIKKESIIELTKVVKESYEDSFIQFNEGVAMVRSFGNHWKVIIENADKSIEDLTDWIPYNKAYKEAMQLVA